MSPSASQAHALSPPAPPCEIPLMASGEADGGRADSELRSSPADAAWFAEEVQPHATQLKAYLRGSFPGVRDVEDVVQESFIRVWKRQLSGPLQSAKGFLFNVARHLAIDVVRHNTRSPFTDVRDLAELDVLDQRPNAAEAACTSEELDLLLDAIERLPPRCREIVILRKLRGLSQKEIAARMGIAERTVEVQASKGLDRCEIYLRRYGLRRKGST